MAWGEAWGLAKQTSHSPQSLGRAQQRVGSLLRPKNLRQRLTHPGPVCLDCPRTLPGTAPPEGQVHPQLWLPWPATAPTTGRQGGLHPPAHSGVHPAVFLFSF